MRLIGLPILAILAFSSAHAGSVTGAGGVTIKYERHGTGGSTIVFVHGWTCDRSYWHEQVEVFSRDHAVIAIDLGGHGESSSDRDDWSIAAFGEDVAAVVEAEDLQDIVLVGHSMGGPVVIEAAQRLGDRVRMVVAVDTLQEPTRAPYTEEQSLELWAPFREAFAPALEDFVRKSFFLPTAPADIVDFVAKDMASASPDMALAAGHALTTWSAPEGIAAIGAIPFVLINANYRPSDEAGLHAVHPNARLLLINDVGHFPMLVRPLEFNETLKSTLSR